MRLKLRIFIDERQIKTLMQKPDLLLFIVLTVSSSAQKINLSAYDKTSETKVFVSHDQITIHWTVNSTEYGKMLLDLKKDQPLFKSIELTRKGSYKKIAADLDPAFILTIGKRDLISQNGWNIFFDKVPQKPHKSFVVDFDKRSASVKTYGARTIITISQLHAGSF